MEEEAGSALQADESAGRIRRRAAVRDEWLRGGTGWWGAGIGIGAIGGSFVSARWLRRRRLS